MAHLGRSIFVVAIDLGTTYSGYAFSSIKDIQNDPPQIYASNWQGSNLLSMKCPTALLLDENKEFVAFGYEAENIFSDKLAEEEHEDFYYFHQFKMLLYNQRVTRKTEIKEISGKSMEALTVFSIAINYLKDHVTKKIQQKLNGKLTNDDFYYVLTVPTFWDDSAKQFMCEAAGNAGIKRQKLVIALEPEAASIFCQTIRSYRKPVANRFYQIVKDGKPYMVIDIGGGTVDIAVHQRKEDGTIQEVIPPCGGPWGGKSVNDAFRTFLCDVCGPSIVKQLQEEELEDYIELFRVFETKKRSIRADTTNKVKFTLPVSLIQLVHAKHKRFENVLESSAYKISVTYEKHNLHISPDVFRDFFKRPITEIVKLVEKLLKDPELNKTDTIFLVGGFAESDLVQLAIREIIKAPRKLIIPEEAGLAVLKGSIRGGIYGAFETFRVERVTRSGQVIISKCVFCTEKGMFYCHDCKNTFCKKCRQNHDKLPVAKNHYVEDATNVGSNIKRTTIICRAHIEEYVYSCVTCKVLICSTCVITTHSGHKIAKMSVLVSESREIAKNQVAKLKSQLKDISSHISLLSTSVIFEAKQEAHCATGQIQNTIDQITKVINEKGRLKLNVIEDTNNLQLEEINFSLNEMKKTYESQQMVCQSIERLLEEKHDVTFYTAYTVLRQELIDLSVIANYERTTRVEPFDKERFVGDLIETLLSKCNMRLHSFKDGKIVVKAK